MADPVASGIVSRLDRPSGNITGFANFEDPLGGKLLELLSNIAPELKRAAIMFNPDTSPRIRTSVAAAARSLKVVLIPAPVHSDVEIETAIIGLGREPGGGLLVSPDAFMFVHPATVIMAAARHNTPAAYNSSVFARDGGLLSYGGDQLDTGDRVAAYVDRILRGAKPSHLPVQFPTKYEMAALAVLRFTLGLTIPLSILALAEEVIE